MGRHSPYFKAMRLLFALMILPLPAFAEIRILAMGDSVMAWNWPSGRDIPNVVEDRLGADVRSEAVPAARFSNSSGLGRALGFDVRSQFRQGEWDVILVNGGPNDFLADCGCSRCEGVLDSLITEDFGGDIPTTLSALTGTGAQVVYMGYYASARSAQFTGCRPYIVEMERRIARFAGTNPNIHFIDSEDVIDREDRSLFAGDGVHPSPKGARIIGTYIADFVAGLL